MTKKLKVLKERRAGLMFPVGRMIRKMKIFHRGSISDKAGIAMAATL